jgi:hypothetical protein
MKNLEQLKEELPKGEQMTANAQLEFKGGMAKAYWDDKRRERPGSTRSVVIRTLYVVS